MDQQTERRRDGRATLPAAYTSVRVRREGRQRFTLDGHAYDLSRTGMRLELDHALRGGEQVDLQIRLPGCFERVIRASGRVVRHVGLEEPGPVRMAVAFTDFQSPGDREQIDFFLRRAA